MEEFELLTKRLNLEERLEDMFCAYFRRYLGEDIQYLKTFDFCDVAGDYIGVKITIGGATGSELPKTELTGAIEQREFATTLAVSVFNRRRSSTSKTKIIQLASKLRALMLRGFVYRSPELFAEPRYFVFSPPNFNGLEFDADDDGDSATLQYSFNLQLTDKIFKQ